MRTNLLYYLALIVLIQIMQKLHLLPKYISALCYVILSTDLAFLIY